jgi:hypothetical protein
MHRPVSTARAISLVITISTGIRSKRRATQAAWRLPSSESGVCTCWYAPCSLPSVDPCRTKYTVFISALWFVPQRNAGLSVIKRLWLSDGDRYLREGYLLTESLRDGTCQLFDTSGSKRKPHHGCTGHCALIRRYAWGFRAVVPDAYAQATGPLHPARYHSIVLPCAGSLSTGDSHARTISRP